MGACVFATAGLCGAATIAAIGVSAHGNYKSWRRGKISGRRAFFSTGFDAVGYKFRALRGYRARHALGRARWVTTSHRIARRSHPWRYGARAAYNAGSLYKTYRG